MMSPRHIAAILCLACIAGPAASQPEDLEWIDFAAVDDGEVVFQTERVARGTVRIDLAIAIDAEPAVIWDLLVACEISPEYVPHVIACRQLATIDDCDCEFFEQTVKPAFFLPSFEHVFSLEYFRPDRITISHVSGPLDRMEGGWRLLERPGRKTVLLHSLTVKPGFPVPPLFVRNTLKKDVPTVLTELRSRAEGATAE